jgi:ubiquinone/menaquinone biosynthesis C-methylase UbiE
VLDADRQPSKSTLFFASFIRPTDRVLELGCANGYVLEQLRRQTGCACQGVDPSSLAIHNGSSRYPALSLSIGTADDLDLADGSFDVVLLGFCLYVTGRPRLPRVVAEVDRVLVDGGRLLLTDFDPIIPHRRADKHQPGLASFKTQYAGLWLANPQYVLVEKISFSHQAQTFHDDPAERVASWALAKQPIEIAYPLLP